MAKFKVGDRVTDGSAIYAITGVDDDIYEWKVVSGKADPSYSEGGEVAWAEAKMRRANSRTPRSSNAVVRNALAARNAGIWESAKEAEDRSDVFVRAALGRTKYNFDTEAGTLREVIKLLASAEQTPKIKKNTEKLKGILSRVEKAAALFKGI